MNNQAKPIIQPNHLSTARITLTALQKNIIYIIIDELQKVMTKDVNAIFEEQQIKVEFKEIDSNNNYARIRKATRDLSSKSVEYDVIIPNTGKVRRTDTSLLSGIEYELHSKYISFIIPSRASVFFCYIGGGFTSFQKTIALSLNSIYSKIMYEFCCRWIDKGGYTCTIDFFKEQLNIKNKYRQVSHLRNKVLNPAKKELQNNADVYFSYSLSKEGRKFSHISFKIIKNAHSTNSEFKGVRQEDYSFIYRFLNIYYPNYTDNKAQIYTDAIVDNGNSKRAFERFKRLDKELSSGAKNKIDITNLLNSIILKEMNVL